jgi:DNA-binding NarL/FixJ family response regulator
VDSSGPFREALGDLLRVQPDFDLAGIGADGYDLLRLADNLRPDVIILDMDMPLFNGLEMIISLQQRFPCTAIVIIASKINDKTFVSAVRVGVTGFLLRDTVFEDITGAVRSVTPNNYFMSSALAARAFNMFSSMVKNINSGDNIFPPFSETANSQPVCISRSELRVVAFVGQGLTNGQISKILNLKEGTVRNYISCILQKTKLKHRTQIALYALKNGFYCKEIPDVPDTAVDRLDPQLGSMNP